MDKFNEQHKLDPPTLDWYTRVLLSGYNSTNLAKGDSQMDSLVKQCHDLGWKMAHISKHPQHFVQLNPVLH